MPTGYEINATSIHNRCGDAAASMFRAVENIRKVKTWLDTKSTAELFSEYGIDEADGAVLKSALTDLTTVADVFEGATTVASANDFRAFAKRIIGVGQY